MKYVAELNEKTQRLIRDELIAAGIEGEDLEIAMNCKVSDLEEVIDVKKFVH